MSSETAQLNNLIETAIRIARMAGALLLDHASRPRKVFYKEPVNPVTEADRESEALILRELAAAFPTHSVLAEESGELLPLAPGASADYIWLVDPLDGTVNFAHGFPVWSVSLALRQGDAILLGVVYDPERDECFTATAGGGAFLNGQPIHVSAVDQLHYGLLATGFPYNRQTAALNNSEAVAAFLRKGQGIRRPGSAALDLCYVACGRTDGYWELVTQPWDTGAGLLVLREAGGRVTDYRGDDSLDAIFRGKVLSSNGLIHAEMQAVLAEVYGEQNL